jgi:hypothetical protein
MEKLPLILSLTCTLFTSVPGCALFGSGDPPRAKYSLNAPQNWKSEERAESDLAFILPSGNTVTVSSSCTRDSRAPLDLLTRHLLIGTRNVVVERREKMSVHELVGLYSSVRATVDKIPFHMEVFVIAREACIYDFMLLSPSEISRIEANEFRDFIRSIHFAKN